MDKTMLSEDALSRVIAYIESCIDDGHATLSLAKLREHIAAQADALEEAKAKRVEANNQWRLDYNEMAGNAELLQEQVIEAVEPFAEFQRVAKTQAQSKRGDFWLALHSDKGHLAKITYDDFERLLALGARLSRAQPGQDDAP